MRSCLGREISGLGTMRSCLGREISDLEGCVDAWGEKSRIWKDALMLGARNLGLKMEKSQSGVPKGSPKKGESMLRVPKGG
jgi:hypothetical protein